MPRARSALRYNFAEPTKLRPLPFLLTAMPACVPFSFIVFGSIALFRTNLYSHPISPRRD